MLCALLAHGPLSLAVCVRASSIGILLPCDGGGLREVATGTDAVHLLEQAPLRCDQFAQVTNTDVIAGGNRHQCERTGRRCGAALHPSQRPHFGGWVLCAGLALSMKQCSSLPPFYRKHRFTRQDSQDNEHECSVAFLTLLISTTKTSVCCRACPASWSLGLNGSVEESQTSGRRSSSPLRPN